MKGKDTALKKISAWEYDNETLEQAEIDANRFNLIFVGALMVFCIFTILLSAWGVFTIDLSFMTWVILVSMLLFTPALIVFLVHDIILKKKRTILKWRGFKYVIYVPTYFGLLFLDFMFSYHAVIMIVVPPLMAAQYAYNRRDWYLILITTVVSIPIIVYGSFIFGFPDRNMIKGMLTDEEAAVIANRIAILTPQRALELFSHYCLPRILSILVVDFLVAAIVKRHWRTLTKQNELSEKVAQAALRHTVLQREVIEELAAVIETRDVGTGEHIKRTKAYVQMLCEQLAVMEEYKGVLTKEKINRIVAAAPLHDIGKIAVSDLILLKPGKLTAEEFDKMKEHSHKGGFMIKTFFNHFEDKEFLQEAYDIAMYHHEKWNGTGYPEGLKGDSIPLAARIMAVSDVYDALVSKRVYKDPYPSETAINIIVEDSGKHFDPAIVRAMLEIKDDFIRVAAEDI